MANIPERKTLTSFHSLPPEICHDIFQYIYPPWHFEYTQVHDTLPTHGPKDIKSAVTDLAAEFTGTPRFSNLPSIAPLLACRDFYNAGCHIFDSSFTGHIHVISGMIWKEVHWTYACIMAKATTLTINLCHLKSLHQCRILDRLPNLENITIVCTALLTPRTSFSEPFRHEHHEAEPHLLPDRLSLEGSEVTSFLPNDIDLSDTTLQKYWNDTITQGNFLAGNMLHAYHFYIDNLNREILLSMKVKTVCRAVIGVPVLPEYAEQGIAVFLILDFQKAFWNGSAESSSDDTDLYILVRKRLAMLKREVS